jgi:hypothetical protein
MHRALDFDDRLAQQIDQRIADARVRDARGREKEPHARPLNVEVTTLSSRVDRFGLMRKTGWTP